MMWVVVAVLRNVKELDLDIDFYEFELPNCLIACESLWVLKLYIPNPQLPGTSNFKQLTSLYLKSIMLTDDGLIQRLFSECSFLEDLILINFYVSQMNVLDISSSSLKCLTLTCAEMYADFDEVRKCEIRISCPNLLSFTYLGLVAKNYCLDNISSLDYMCIDIFTEVYYNVSMDMFPVSLVTDEEVGHLACKILKQVENIKVQHLQAPFMHFSGYTEQNEHWQLHDEGNANWESHLKTVRLIDFEGKEHELEFVKFMLTNGHVLEEFIFSWWVADGKTFFTQEKDFNEKNLGTFNKVLNFPKASSLVEVKMVPRRGDLLCNSRTKISPRDRSAL